MVDLLDCTYTISTGDGAGGLGNSSKEGFKIETKSIGVVFVSPVVRDIPPILATLVGLAIYDDELGWILVRVCDMKFVYSRNKIMKHDMNNIIG